MENALARSNSKFCLVGKINGLALQSKQARHRINKSAAKKDNKGVWRAAYRKVIIGADTRHHLLAYAFLRGTPYSKLERECRIAPDPKLIFQVVEAHAPKWIPYDPKTGRGFRPYTVCLVDIENWLKA